MVATYLKVTVNIYINEKQLEEHLDANWVHWQPVYFREAKPVRSKYGKRLNSLKN